MSAVVPGIASDRVLAAIAARATARDRDPSGVFPTDAIRLLADAGAIGGERRTYADELALLRQVATADAGVGRILDGHLNAVERLGVQGPKALRERERDGVRDGTLWCGVWGADPAPGGDEGEPARLDGDTITGTKVFCSGAGGLHRALVLVREDGATAPSAAWVDLTAAGTVEVDRSWFAGNGMRSSVSHRVVFHGAPVLAVLGGPGALTEQPWFARDAVRTAATWAGTADAAADDALRRLASKDDNSELTALAAGRIATWRHGLGLWLGDAARTLDDPTCDAATAGRTAAQLRTAIADAARAILDEAERALGSRPAATGATLDRAARDLRLFLLQHRLEPILARAGRAELEGRR
ncbi:hypothetical protein [Baekduia sp. Peel2402]|uniref:hypothetical protein n=1 Tax=Baekduia sp. Peel2402 TaxID=3458296 RepID=UPI00403E427F